MVKKQITWVEDQPTTEERLLTISEVARILHVSRSLVYWLIYGGRLPTLRIRHALRFRKQDVEQYIRITARKIPTKQTLPKPTPARKLKPKG